jgi:AcrR family transcriptional regulator
MPYKSKASLSQSMRSRLLDAAQTLFEQHGASKVTVAQVAQLAGAFPNQVTHHFSSKDAMFVEAACRSMLHTAAALEKAAERCKSLATYTHSLAQQAAQSPSLPFFLEALALAQRQASLSPQVARTMERLQAEGARALEAIAKKRAWQLDESAQVIAKRFWALVVGVGASGLASGAQPDALAKEINALLNLRPVLLAPAKPLTLVKARYGKS